MFNKSLIVIAVIAIAGLVYFKFMPPKSSNTQVLSATAARPEPPKAGDKLADLPVSKFAFAIFPGEPSEAAKTAMTGFELATVANEDGTTTITLTPKDQDDKKSSYKVSPGQTLYFVETSKGDDNPDQNKDMFLRDDYGVLVDEAGIVQ